MCVEIFRAGETMGGLDASRRGPAALSDRPSLQRWACGAGKRPDGRSARPEPRRRRPLLCQSDRRRRGGRRQTGTATALSRQLLWRLFSRSGRQQAVCLLPRGGGRITHRRKYGFSSSMSPELLFWFGLALKMAMTAAVVVITSLVVERAGSFLGALVGSLPTAAGAAYTILALDHPPSFIAASAIGSVAVNGAIAIFAVTYAALAQRHSLLVSLGVATALWFAAAAALRTA